MAAATIPPTTPPAIAAILVFFDFRGGDMLDVDVIVGLVEDNEEDGEAVLVARGTRCCITEARIESTQPIAGVVFVALPFPLHTGQRSTLDLG